MKKQVPSPATSTKGKLSGVYDVRVKNPKVA